MALENTDMARDTKDYLVVVWENISTMILLDQLPKQKISYVLKYVIKSQENLAGMLKNSSVEEQEKRFAFLIKGNFCLC